jgi:hypothetical protein
LAANHNPESDRVYIETVLLGNLLCKLTHLLVAANPVLSWESRVLSWEVRTGQIKAVVMLEGLLGQNTNVHVQMGLLLLLLSLQHLRSVFGDALF